MLQGVAPLDHLGVIRAEGEDAAKFLHGQLYSLSEVITTVDLGAEGILL